ncbi:TonB-dependent receptor [Aequoribacter fuscus]|jgi:iron complex outermembrane receptor protein|uniref:TonB-dependent receptor n=1 Tax=Aequoribacter fuscus TaxID=2518989 RepID=F3L5Y1_9GAMM|nr:TonB-dependent receptor [Aequoribacter fuscus]EGG28262.1 TonB-dependent receptor [Aequoribacter fuscus]QHJ88346.1 TonB-dependent receptor [Aequoribacter fuscus]
MSLNKQTKRSVLALSVAAAVGGFSVPSAFSQSVLMEEVIVTAQKREESNQNIPISITAMSAEMMEKRGIQNTQDLLLQTPGMGGFESPGSKGTTAINMRGVGAGQPANLSVDPAIGIYVDGVFIGKQVGSALDVAEVERIEVLRGPQGTLYGRNTVGGAVNFISKKPTGEFDMKIQAGVGNYGAKKFRVVTNLPAVGEVGSGLGQLSTNFVYQTRERDPFYDDVDPSKPGYNDQDRQAYRFAANLDVSERFSIDYIYDKSELDELNNLERIVGVNPLDPAGNVPLIGTLQGLLQGAQFWGSNPAADPLIASRWVPSLQKTIAEYQARLAEGSGRKSKGASDSTPVTVTEADGHNLSLTWDFDDFQVKSITAQREIESYVGGDLEDLDSRLDANGIGAYGDLVHLTLGQIYGGTVAATAGLFGPGTPGVAFASPFTAALWNAIDTQGANQSYQDTYSDYEQFSQELQVVGSKDLVEYAFGIYYFEDESNYDRYAIFAAPLTGNGSQKYRLETEAVAVYGQMTFRPSEDSPFAATFGIRYTEEDKSIAYNYPAYNTPFGPAPALVGDDAESFDDISYTLALSYQPSDDLNVYGRYATGYRSGGFNGEQAGSDAFQEEKVNSWELGAKSSLMDGRLRANFALWGYVWEDIQVAVSDTSSGSITSGLVNAGEADRWGSEIELMGALSDNLVLGFNYSYINGDFEEFPDVCGFSGICIDGTSAATRGTSPSNQYSVFADFTVARLSNGEITGFVNASYSDEIAENALWSQILNDADGRAAFPRVNPPQILDQKTLVNAQLAWQDIQVGDGTLTVTLWGRNLLDDDYPNYSINFGGLNFITESYGDPKTYGLDFTYEF